MEQWRGGVDHFYLPASLGDIDELGYRSGCTRSSPPTVIFRRAELFVGSGGRGTMMIAMDWLDHHWTSHQQMTPQCAAGDL